ncbi:uncharacterized protein METZ01_LOCUS514439 [marine metagenome]|uniref:Uncharacterized protein n=1 Tax=marine metagenome TaxID=408172 RepID=A0A383EZF1_9ZZZZ
MNWLACSETASRLRAPAGGSVAQLVEQWPFKPLVRGSSPRAPTIFCPNIIETFPVKQPNRAKLLTMAYTVLTQTEKGKSTDETESNPLLSALWQWHSKGFPIRLQPPLCLITGWLTDKRQRLTPPYAMSTLAGRSSLRTFGWGSRICA